MTKRDDYVNNNMPIKKDAVESRIYEEEKNRYEAIIDNIETDIKNKKIKQRNFMVEMDAFIETLQSSDMMYRTKSYVRKRKLANLFFSNIIINKKKQVLIRVKP
jgi:CHAT domain-containing protein